MHCPHNIESRVPWPNHTAQLRLEARRRVIIKRQLRRIGIFPPVDASTRELRRLRREI